ncbi:hypothetical protein BDA96_03G456000 [Sorghum bicolor]|uniref:Crossover junction endonuclease MUS81 n=2 Tax=Sorghum bicolor TaxID=4558 RepID=A0A921RJD0_SORBI|nr:crossover junction endonuclease MUS81 [Sorghum bicolor]KAG0540979.1 hypothetical protein BDA96_03G456000 [Sorghum bicolor]KXG34105.1 hypothetical protein SORBI_3003G423800 [Sorghum bicolor]|eukprot:XP_021311253.1 crossover junction endonuclease MUS81 [Sorghum bicolor]
MRPPPKKPKEVQPVPKQLKVHNPENESLSRFFLEKWRAMMQEPDGLSPNNYLAFANANRSLCSSKEPIRTLKDFSNVKGVGPWLIQHMKSFFAESNQDLSPAKGKKPKMKKRYLPGKNTAAYAILITLLRAKANGKDFMMKQELIDAAEASGLSRDAIGPNKSKAKQSYGKDWYTGWSCMKTLQSNGLVTKSSNPAKYKLTREGEGTARECLSRSGLDDSHNTSAMNPSVSRHSPELVGGSSLTKKKSSCYHQVQTTNYEGIICCDSDSEEPCGKNIPLKGKEPVTSCGLPDIPLPFQGTPKLQSSTMGCAKLAMPPRRANENFLEAYEVILILDDREKFGSRSRKVADNIRSQSHFGVEVRQLPVGDGIWIARHKEDHAEYVLDFIVERKEVTDLDGSIEDNRYKDQKFRMQKCGLSKLIYLVEGDPNRAPHRVKTACFTTEVLDGFDVQRTTGFADTQKRYIDLTHSIIAYYDANFSIVGKTSHVCPTYDEFKRECCELKKKTVSDIFSLQLMQVPKVTEEAAQAVVELYPTPFLLAKAYSILDGDIPAQEKMLKNKNEMVNAGASRNIFHFIWRDGGNTVDPVPN